MGSIRTLYACDYWDVTTLRANCSFVLLEQEQNPLTMNLESLYNFGLHVACTRNLATENRIMFWIDLFHLDPQGYCICVKSVH